jgi:hypothetical protein
MAEISRFVQDNTDGVGLLIDPILDKTIHGISIRTGWNSAGDLKRLLVSHFGETYHNHKENNDPRTVHWIIKRAISAWRKRREANADSNPTHRIGLHKVFLDESRAAGKLRSRNRAFVGTNGMV